MSGGVGGDVIPFTRPVLPDLTAVQALLAQIWERGIVTNGGPVQQAFEAALVDRLSWPGAVAAANGTAALRLMCLAAGLEGEVIYSSFTHAATVQALVGCGLTPVPADIRADDLTVDVDAVRALIGPRTSGILVTHTFGNPADVEALSDLAAHAGIALLFDAAAAVGVRYRNRALADFGLASAYSFHATKLLCSVEGGAVSSGRAELLERVRVLRNFGISEEAHADPLGGNGKSNEILCGIGMLGLDGLAAEIDGRARAIAQYRAELSGLDCVTFVDPREHTQSNASYCCVRVRRPGGRGLGPVVDDALHGQGIQSRRYFAGSYAVRNVPGVAPRADAAREDVLCLPLWGAIEAGTVSRVSQCVRAAVAGPASA